MSSGKNKAVNLRKAAHNLFKDTVSIKMLLYNIRSIRGTRFFCLVSSVGTGAHLT